MSRKNRKYQHIHNEWLAEEGLAHNPYENHEEPKKKLVIQGITERHNKFLYNIETSTLSFCFGPAGTGKTFLAMAKAWQMLMDDRIEKIYLTRPAITCGDNLGFLPGNMQEKFKPLCIPALENLKEFLHTQGHNPKQVEDAITNGTLELLPLEYMRGRNLRRAVVVADECQNGRYNELKMLVTRFCEGSRMVICGDVRQSDLGPYTPDILRLQRWLFEHSEEDPRDPDMSYIRFTDEDIVRAGLLKFIIRRLEKKETEHYAQIRAKAEKKDEA